MIVVQDTPEILITRHPSTNAGFSLLPEIYVERGTKADWDLLHELHYKAENLGIGPQIYRCVLQGQTIGVGVMTVPKMLSGGRNKVFKHLRPNVDGKDTRIINTSRAVWLNANACTNSRLVLDTMFRGVGIAYRMQNIMMRMTGRKLVEFQSSMSKFNPFAAKAGVKFIAPTRAANYERGMALFRRWFEAIPSDYLGVMAELETMPAPVQAKCLAELRKFYFTFSSMERSGNNRFNGYERVEAMKTGYLIKSIQQLVLASPLYGVYENPDAGRELPARIPITAFDRQPTDAPLDLSGMQVAPA